jgi:hypothetical protein
MSGVKPPSLSGEAGQGRAGQDITEYGPDFLFGWWVRHGSGDQWQLPMATPMAAVQTVMYTR